MKKFLKKGFIDPLTLGVVAFFLISLVVTKVAVDKQQSFQGNAAGAGSCQGSPPANCSVSGFAIGGCNGRTQSNCNAVSSCGCHWISDTIQPLQSAPPQQTSNPTITTCNGTSPTATICYTKQKNSYITDGSTCYQCQPTSNNNCAAVLQNPSACGVTVTTNACTNAGGICISSPSCSSQGRSTANGGNGCGNLSQICCSPGITVPQTCTQSGGNCTSGSSCCQGFQCVNGKCGAPILTPAPTPGQNNQPTIKTTPTPLPTPKPNGSRCSNYADCASDYCNLTTQTCEIKPKTCFPVGHSCVGNTSIYCADAYAKEVDTQCATNEYCSINSGTCQTKQPNITSVTPHPTPTPTVGPTSVPTPPVPGNTKLSLDSTKFCADPQGCQCPNGNIIAINLNCFGSTKVSTCTDSHRSCVGSKMEVCTINNAPTTIDCQYGCTNNFCNPNPYQSTTTLPGVGFDQSNICTDLQGCQCSDGKKVATGLNCFGQKDTSKTNKEAYCNILTCKDDCLVPTLNGGICRSPDLGYVDNISQAECSVNYAGCFINNTCVPHNSVAGQGRCCFGSFQDNNQRCEAGYFESRKACDAIKGCYYPNIGSKGSGTCIPQGSTINGTYCQNSDTSKNIANGSSFLNFNSTDVTNYYSQEDSRWADVPLPGGCNEPNKEATVAQAACGPIAVANIIDDHNLVPQTREGISNFINTNYPTMSCRGTSDAQNIPVLNNYGFETDPILCDSLDEASCENQIRQYVENGNKVLLAISISYSDGSYSNSVNHYVVIKGIDENGYFQVIDPPEPNIHGDRYFTNILSAVAVKKR